MNDNQWGSNAWHDNPITLPCDACNAEPGEPCRPMCLGQAQALQIRCKCCLKDSWRTVNRYYCSPECVIVDQIMAPIATADGLRRELLDIIRGEN